MPIHEESLCWLHRYLSGRSLRIRLGDNFSEMGLFRQDYTRVVPWPNSFQYLHQPLLKKLKGVTFAYANDIKYAGNTVISTKEKIQQDLNVIGDWSEAMLMPLSIVIC